MNTKPKKKLSAEDQKFYENRAKWVDAAFRADFGHAEFRVLYFIAQRSNHEKRGSHWSVSRIAEECRCSTRTVSDATTKAHDQGYLQVYRTLGQENFYELLFFWDGVTQ
jgi:DNA-binding MarR family transcriptional regulator